MRYNMSRTEVEELGYKGRAVISETDSTRLVRVLNSFDMFVLKDDASLSPSLIEHGFWESWITSWMTKFLRPGMTFLDIGANCGYYSMVADLLVGRYGNVVAYEPNPVYAELLQNTRNINDANFKIREVALTEKSGTAQLYVPENYHGSAALHGVFDGYEISRVYDVRTTTLDLELLNLIFFRHDVVKIDAEESEEKIWMGGNRIWDSLDHTTIVMEYTPGAYTENFLDELFSWGRVSIIGYDGEEELVSINWIKEQTDWRMLVVRKK